MLLNEFNQSRITKSTVKEQHTDDNPMAQALTRRIINSRLDLIQQYGPTAVSAAIDAVTDNDNDWDEIGTSDVSAWVKDVERYLKNYVGKQSESVQERKGEITEQDPPAAGAAPGARLAARAGAQPGANTQQTSAAYQQKLLDRMGARFGLPPGSSMEQVKAAQQSWLEKNDPAAAAQFKQNMTNIAAGQSAANQPIQLAPQAAPQMDPDTAAGLQAAKSSQSPLAIMLAQPSIANNQQALDAIASSYGLPAGLSAAEIQAQGEQSNAQRALDDVAKTVGLPPGSSREQILAAYQQQQQAHFNKVAGVQQPQASTESKEVTEIDNPLDAERREQRAYDRDREQFKRDELSYELRGEEERMRQANSGTWYLRINGRIWKKNGQPVEFRGRDAVVRAGQTIKNRTPSKNVVITKNPVDDKSSDVTENDVGGADKEKYNQLVAALNSARKSGDMERAKKIGDQLSQLGGGKFKIDIHGQAKQFNEFKDEEEAGDLRTGWLIKKAKRQFPMATSDAEAVAMWMNDKTEKEIDRIDRVNDFEDAMIDRLADVDKRIQAKLQDLDARIGRVETARPNESRSVKEGWFFKSPEEKEAARAKSIEKEKKLEQQIINDLIYVQKKSLPELINNIKYNQFDSAGPHWWTIRKNVWDALFFSIGRAQPVIDLKIDDELKEISDLITAKLKFLGSIPGLFDREQSYKLKFNQQMMIDKEYILAMLKKYQALLKKGTAYNKTPNSNESRKATSEEVSKYIAEMKTAGYNI